MKGTSSEPYAYFAPAIAALWVANVICVRPWRRAASMTVMTAWCVALASIIYFSVLKSGPVLHGWLIPILLSITVPVTTLLLARTGLFRKRMAGDDVPAEVSSRR